ncbi:neuropeptide SIFamide receptor-like [Anopheles cruzii]|uniref:neuropeptide SIFamide receptor-like n=1 Tax=Anopheles cruzii TaxID=68878 RepID=UPI0022EC254C|nr:neuropeptide SIFamide receptor-like [Anopheles cruzii]
MDWNASSTADLLVAPGTTVFSAVSSPSPVTGTHGGGSMANPGTPAGDVTIATVAQHFHAGLPFPSELLTFLRQTTTIAASASAPSATGVPVSSASVTNLSTFLSNITLRALTASSGPGGAGTSSSAEFTANLSRRFPHHPFFSSFYNDSAFEICPSIQMPVGNVISMILYALVAIVGLFGNTLVIYVVLRFSKMQTVTNMYILNLAIADQCFLIGIPFLITTMHLGEWTFGNGMCKAYMVSTSITQFTSSIFLFIMSADRYIAVCHPISSPRFRTPLVSKVVSAIAWTASALIMLPVMLYANTIHREKNKMSCNIMWPSETGANSGTTFTLYSLILGFAIPLSLILMFYYLVIRKLRTVGPKSKSKEKKRSHRKVTKLVLTVITVYVLCWLPYWISQVALINSPPDICKSRLEITVFVLVSWLGYSNSAMNPILYAFLSDNFKKSFLKACTCAKGKEINAQLQIENSFFPRFVRNRGSERGNSTKVLPAANTRQAKVAADQQQQQQQPGLHQQQQQQQQQLQPPVLDNNNSSNVNNNSAKSVVGGGSVNGRNGSYTSGVPFSACSTDQPSSARGSSMTAPSTSVTTIQSSSYRRPSADQQSSPAPTVPIASRDGSRPPTAATLSVAATTDSLLSSGFCCGSPVSTAATVTASPLTACSFSTGSFTTSCATSCTLLASTGTTFSGSCGSGSSCFASAPTTATGSGSFNPWTVVVTSVTCWCSASGFTGSGSRATSDVFTSVGTSDLSSGFGTSGTVGSTFVGGTTGSFTSPPLFSTSVAVAGFGDGVCAPVAGSLDSSDSFDSDSDELSALRGLLGAASADATSRLTKQMHTMAGFIFYGTERNLFLRLETTKTRSRCTDTVDRQLGTH